jgi:DNA-binding response OmpR family regulator
MSVLTNKKVLVVGNVNHLITTLVESLEAHGATVSKIACAQVTESLLHEQGVDLIIINGRESDSSCQDALKLVGGPLVERAIPVFALIEDTPEMVQDILSLGVADYFTEHEDPTSVLSKIKAVFGQNDLFAGSTTIDISPIEASVTTAGIRVFVVEDDPLLRNLLSLKMDKTQFPYEFSVDGNNAISAMHQFKPDVIILDLMLPGKSGLEVLAEVRADSRLREVPVIVFSNRDGQDDRKKASELGAQKFYVKAMTDLSELIETIESLVK